MSVAVTQTVGEQDLATDKDANLCSKCWGDRDKKSKDPALKELIVQGNLQVNKTQ